MTYVVNNVIFPSIKGEFQSSPNKVLILIQPFNSSRPDKLHQFEKPGVELNIVAFDDNNVMMFTATGETNIYKIDQMAYGGIQGTDVERLSINIKSLEWK